MKSQRFYGILTGLIVLSVFNIRFSIGQELLNFPLDTVNGVEVYRYAVEKSIGLYRISANFGVPQSEIVRYNPQISEHGIRYGETLIIPTGRPVIIESTPVVLATTTTEMPVEQTTPQTPLLSADTARNEHRIVAVRSGVTELALMLPFESRQTKRSSNAERMMEFYQGVLLALQEMQNDSVRFRLRVYDIERSERHINTLCESTELDSVKAVLGTVYPIQNERMAAWCAAHNVPLLLPFSDDFDLASHPQVLQFNATDTQEADSLCQWIMARDSMTHCVAIEGKGLEMASAVQTLRRQMSAHNINCAGIKLHDLLNDSAAYALDSTKENLIILHSDKFQHVRILLPHLIKLQAEGYAIRVVGQYSWKKEEIGLPYVYTSVFTAKADREEYEQRWNSTFNPDHVSDTPRFDLLGYDLTHALVAWLNGATEIQGIQSDIRWQQMADGGYQNQCVRVIAY